MVTNYVNTYKTEGTNLLFCDAEFQKNELMLNEK